MRPTWVPRCIRRDTSVLRQLAFDALLQSIGRSRIEALADQRIEVVAQRLCQLFIGYPADVGLLDDVARVDVVVAIGHFLAADDEEHARLPVGIHDGAHGGDVSWSLAFDAGGKCVEARLCESGAGEVANVLAKAGTQAIDVESGHLRRDDDRAFRDDGLLIGRGLGGGDEQGEEQAKCAHARGESKERAHRESACVQEDSAIVGVTAGHTCARAATGGLGPGALGLSASSAISARLSAVS